MSGYSAIPPDTLGALERYKDDKIPTGGFLRAVLSNDLVQAYGRADARNVLAMESIIRYCYWELPGDCWGSPKKVRSWLESKHDGRLN